MIKIFNNIIEKFSYFLTGQSVENDYKFSLKMKKRVKISYFSLISNQISSIEITKKYPQKNQQIFTDLVLESDNLNLKCALLKR